MHHVTNVNKKRVFGLGTPAVVIRKKNYGKRKFLNLTCNLNCIYSTTKLLTMHLMSVILTAFVAIEHLYILWMEMFAWETAGKKAFGGSFPDELFKPTKGLAANQGLYNGFLAAGLGWSFLISDPAWSVNVRLFFLGCVVVAGVFGALSASKKIFFIQALPALIAIIFVAFSRG
jgi:putative membrane protein